MKRLVQSVLYALQGLDVNAMNLIKRDALRSGHHAQHLGDRLFRNGNALAGELCCERRYRNALARASLGNMLAQAHFVNLFFESVEEGGYRSGRSRFRVQERVLRVGGRKCARTWVVRDRGGAATWLSLNALKSTIPRGRGGRGRGGERSSKDGMQGARLPTQSLTTACCSSVSRSSPACERGTRVGLGRE